jgi:WD repeat-containing protein 35
VLSSAYICSFSDLEIQAVLLDQLMREPEAPSKEYLVKFETKALRDARELLDKGNSLSEAAAFIEENPNPRLWRLLAEVALQKLDFVTADKVGQFSVFQMSSCSRLLSLRCAGICAQF